MGFVQSGQIQRTLLIAPMGVDVHKKYSFRQTER